MSRAAGGALVVALAVLAWAIVDAAQTEPLLEAGGRAEDEPSDVEVTRIAYSEGRSEIAIAANPFSPDRRPPPTPFRIEAAANLGPYDHSALEPTGPHPDLIGTARVGPKAFVLASFPGEEPRVVRVGESIGGWTLTRVDGSLARFISGEGVEVELEVGASR